MTDIIIYSALSLGVGFILCHTLYLKLETKFFGEKTLVLEKVSAYDNQIKDFKSQIKNLSDLLNSNINTVGNCNVKVTALEQETKTMRKNFDLNFDEHKEVLNGMQSEIDWVQDHNFKLRDGLSDLREVVSKKRAPPKQIKLELNAEDLSNALFPTKIDHRPSQKDFKAVIKNRVKDLKLDKQAKELSR